MKKITVLLVLQLVFVISIYSQNNRITISGSIYNVETGEVIEGVHVYNKTLENGTITYKSGYYKLKSTNKPSKIIISHVAYHDTIINIESSKNITINIGLTPKVDILATAIITPIVDIIKEKPLYIWDYSFYDDDILILGCRNKKINRPVLVMMEANGDTICSLALNGKRPENLFTDCMNNNHLITKSTAYQVYFDSTEIKLLYPNKLCDFENSLGNCVTELDDKLYFHQYYYKNQVLKYYYIDSKDSTSQEIRLITDVNGLAMLTHSRRFIEMGKAIEVKTNQRFEEMCFYDEIFVPLVKLNDSIIIFNYVFDNIEIYDGKAVFIKDVPIVFHKDKNWKEEIYIDEIKGKAYTIFKTDGISYLHEINIHTGELENKATIPDFLFVENIKIRDNVVYFLYREKENQEYNKLYKMRI